MARSTYVYLALVFGQPVMAFTVKYELVGWLRNWIRDTLQQIQAGLRLWRLDDGGVSTPISIDQNELLGPEGVG